MFVIIFGQFCVLGPVYMHGGATSSPGRISKAREKRPGDEVDGGGYTYPR